MAYDPFEWAKDLQRNVSTDLMRQIVEDNRSRPSSGGSMIPDKVNIVGAGRVSTPDYGPKYRAYQPPAEDTDKSGWKEGTPLRPPEGVNYVDALCDKQDALDKAARVKQLIEAAAALQALKPREDRGDKT
jgi:hypothetical protein